MVDSGVLLQAGPDNVCLVADNDQWLDPMLERFSCEEAARRAVAEVIGVLSLCAPAGGRGQPVGHIVAYKASLELQLKFVKALYAKSKEWGYEEVSW